MARLLLYIAVLLLSDVGDVSDNDGRRRLFAAYTSKFQVINDDEIRIDARAPTYTPNGVDSRPYYIWDIGRGSPLLLGPIRNHASSLINLK
jgi:hypothetical protein